MQNLNKIKFLLMFLLLASVWLIITSCGDSNNEKIIGEEYAKLTQAPYVPPPISRKHSTKVIVDLEVRELIKELAEGVEYTVWTFGGDVPGSFIRVREGDFVEFRLHNHPSSKLPHNIDLHAVTGPGGGAEASFTTPGHSSVFTFTAKNPGLYVYHCATAPVGLHIANGMYGLIYVEPKTPLPKVDKEFYIMQSEFYTEGNYGEPGYQPFSMAKALTETPDYVVFNGSVGSLMGDKSIKAKVGETVRLFVGNGGPNLVSSFHVIGEIFDKVYNEGGTKALQENVQTTIVPAGGSTIVEFKVDVPGGFILVDHSIFRAFNKGAIGKLDVKGPENEEIFSGKIEDKIYDGFLSASQSNINSFTGELTNKNNTNEYVSKYGAETDNQNNSYSTTVMNNENTGKSKPDFMSLGQSIYNSSCSACHQADGKGLPNVFPPLLNSDWMKKNKEGSISAVVHGMTGTITVNGKSYNGIMPPQNLNDEQTAAVLTYVYNKFLNSSTKVSTDEVKKVRASKK